MTDTLTAAAHILKELIGTKYPVVITESGKQYKVSNDTHYSIETPDDMIIELESIRLHNARSTGGRAILDRCIVKITMTKGKEVLYQHPTYHIKPENNTKYFKKSL